MPLLSIVINGDTRVGYLNDKSTVGDYGAGSLQGVRSSELLVAGLKNKMDFFDGYERQCIFVIDQHEPLSDALFMEINELVKSYGNGSKLIVKTFDHASWKWNDKLYIESLKEATGDYVVHFDNDCAAFKKEGFDIVKAYMELLDAGFKYVCQPWDRIGDDMYWASTRFFICKRETLDFEKIEQHLYINPLMGKNNPCFEHTAGLLAGEGRVFYPKRQDDKYIIFCWASYFSGLLKHLMEQPYEETIAYLQDCGLFGSHDIISKPINND